MTEDVADKLIHQTFPHQYTYLGFPGLSGILTRNLIKLTTRWSTALAVSSLECPRHTLYGNKSAALHVVVHFSD